MARFSFQRKYFLVSFHASITIKTAYISTRKKIYFDGFLPQSKLETRLQRLRRLTADSLKYYHLNRLLHQKSTTRETGVSLSECSPRKKFSPWLPPPFIVPLVLETLCQSKKYQYKTEVVPWEADAFCAGHVKKYGGLILTADSDLLIYDLGLHGKVAFFRDMKESTGGSLNPARVYHPFMITRRLGLEISNGLCSLAFELIQSSRKRASAANLATTLRAKNKFPDAYENFMKEYTVKIPDFMSPIEVSEVELFLKLRSLDSRISEYILQFPSFAKVAQLTLSVPNGDEKKRIFLPFILDSPVKTSGWDISVSTRKLAYGLVNLAIPEMEQNKTVLEHRRLTIGLGGKELRLPVIVEISAACINLCQTHLELEKKLPYLCNHEIWIAWAIFQEIGWSRSKSKQSLTAMILEEFSSYSSIQSMFKSFEWELLHLFAQIDASLYSFRILHQISGVVIAKGNRESIPAGLLSLHHILGSLPAVRDFKDRDSIANFLTKHLVQISSVTSEILSVHASDTAQIIL